MKTLTEKMNIKYGKRDYSHVIDCSSGEFSSFDILRFLCSEYGIEIDKIDSGELSHCENTIDSFYKNCNDDTGYFISIWFID